MKLSIDSIILFVQDVDKLKSFYTDILNLKLVEEITNEWVLLKAGNCNIGLHKIGRDYRDAFAEKNTTGSNTKIVFETDEDLLGIREQLIKEQVTVGEIKTFPGYPYWLCDGEDPEGNIFQLRQKKPDDLR